MNTVAARYDLLLGVMSERTKKRTKMSGQGRRDLKHYERPFGQKALEQ
jgi:hypothetical protein